MALEELIAACIAKKEGNKEFALFYFEGEHWHAEIGNPATEAVSLGESCGEFGEDGNSAVEAVQNLFNALNAAPSTDGRIAEHERYLKWLKGGRL